MDEVKLLSEAVSNLIAAGEVIQRPASVVKELVENAVDAGATSIQIIIKDAGRTLIQVVDNGKGMSVTDARMAFERHATSKIRQADDLFSLSTMGFRGEALPSIVAVAEVDMRTMRRDDNMGTRIVLAASEVVSQQPEACVPGTNIKVKNLFFKQPVRRRFLKKDPVELSHIVHEFERLALVNCDIAFTLTSNDVTLHQLMPGSLKQRIGELFGKNLVHQLIPVDVDTSLAKISGFVSLPQNARRRGALQFFFVNGRHMRHPYFHKAVMQCYSELIDADAQPNYFLNFTVDPQAIDVNIHPQKFEVKFENEQPIWQILSAAVRESLGRFNAGAAIDFDRDDAPDIPVFSAGHTAAPAEMPDEGGDPAYNPFEEARRQGRAIPTDWDVLYDRFRRSPAPSSPDEEPPAPVYDPPTPAPVAVGAVEIPSRLNSLVSDTSAPSPATMQLKDRYIVTPSKSGLMIIDQHRAHVRILYERYLAMIRGGEIASQRLIFPETVELDPVREVVARSVADMLAPMGFDISPLGSGTWAINAVPAIIENANPGEAFLDIISAMSDQTSSDNPGESQWQSIALSMARSASIKRGTPLSAKEMDTIIADLLAIPDPAYTPDGHTVLRIITTDDINSLFK